MERIRSKFSASYNTTVSIRDFNNPAEGSGYDLVAKSQLPIRDAYPIAQKKQAEATIEKRIDGWENNKEGLRIDYIYVPQDCFVTSYQRIFDGGKWPDCQ